jgi:hypothetical protein
MTNPESHFSVFVAVDRGVLVKWDGDDAAQRPHPIFLKRECREKGEKASRFFTFFSAFANS